MRAHFLQHVPFEGLGWIEDWLNREGYRISCTRLFAGDPLPEIEPVDLLIIMGGPMSVNDESRYPWLVEEQEFIRKAISCGKPVLGICLGAQLIAKAMGGRVFANPEKEIGWFPVSGIDSKQAGAFRFPDAFDAFHWHGETFSLPPGAIHLARSEACDNQAFQLGDRVIGLQFHLETTPESALALVENCRDELVEAPFVQTEADLRSIVPTRHDSLHGLMNEVLSFLTK